MPQPHRARRAAAARPIPAEIDEHLGDDDGRDDGCDDADHLERGFDLVVRGGSYHLQQRLRDGLVEHRQLQLPGGVGAELHQLNGAQLYKVDRAPSRGSLS